MVGSRSKALEMEPKVAHLCVQTGASPFEKLLDSGPLEASETQHESPDS